MKALLFLILLVAQLPAPARRPAPAQKPAAPSAPHVEVVLYSDFQCPFCSLFARSFRELQAKGVEGVQTSVRFKHFPLDELHPAAQLAHMAALAAAEQGKIRETDGQPLRDQSSL